MEDFKVSTTNGETLVEQVNRGFRIRILKNTRLDYPADAPILQATLYREDSVFVKDSNFIFAAVTDDSKAKETLTVETFRPFVDFFFATILNTDLYVISIPSKSCFCSKELKEFQFD